MFSDSLRPHQTRAYNSMTTGHGQIIIPTGGGKTFVMIADTIRELSNKSDQTIVVVALAYYWQINYVQNFLNRT